MINTIILYVELLKRNYYREFDLKLLEIVQG